MKYESDWLSLREAADGRARDSGFLERLQKALLKRAERLGRPPLIVDLGCGTGALSRALAGKTPPGTRWRLIDKEADLLEVALEEHQGDAAEAFAIDLNADLDRALQGADVIAATAFFDLASSAWISKFVAAAPRTAMVYAALTYDGEEIWTPRHPSDHDVLTAFHAHQRRDFGLGAPALGPNAWMELKEALKGAGFRVEVAKTPWRLERPRDGALMDDLAANTAQAATLFGADGDSWRAAPRESALIGHVDLWATPA